MSNSLIRIFFSNAMSFVASYASKHTSQVFLSSILLVCKIWCCIHLWFPGDLRKFLGLIYLCVCIYIFRGWVAVTCNGGGNCVPRNMFALVQLWFRWGVYVKEMLYTCGGK